MKGILKILHFLICNRHQFKVGQASVEVQTQNGPVDTGGEGGKNWESRTDLYTLPRVKVASGNLLYSSRSSAPCCAMAWGWGVQRWEGGFIC